MHFLIPKKLNNDSNKIFCRSRVKRRNSFEELVNVDHFTSCGNGTNDSKAKNENRISDEINQSGLTEAYLGLPKSNYIQFQSMISNWPSTHDLEGNI